MKIKTAWADLIISEIENPLTKHVELFRNVIVNDRGIPETELTIKIRQSTNVDDFIADKLPKKIGKNAN